MHEEEEAKKRNKKCKGDRKFVKLSPNAKLIGNKCFDVKYDIVFFCSGTLLFLSILS